MEVNPKEADHEWDPEELAPAYAGILNGRFPPDEIPEHIPVKHVVHLISPKKIKVAGVVRKGGLVLRLIRPSPFKDRELPVLLPVQVRDQTGKRLRLVFVHRGILVRPYNDERVGRESNYREDHTEGRGMDQNQPFLERPVREVAEKHQDRGEGEQTDRAIIAGNLSQQGRKKFHDARIGNSHGYSAREHGEIERITVENPLPE